MKYARRAIIIEAFQAGIDDIPEWFMDRVTSGEVILKNDPNEPWCIIKNRTHYEFSDNATLVKRGDYITNSLSPFVIYTPEHFTSTFEPHHENLVSIDLDEHGLGFETKEEVYNSLHEDLRDLRRSVIANNAEEISELLTQLAVTALKARKDLYDGKLCGVRDDG